MTSAVEAGIEVEREIEVPNVVLFPWLAVLIGIAAYYCLSRFLRGLPYTAVMFITGALMGYSALHTHEHGNGEIIILAFLPGLLFLDSYNINVYLFKRSFLQIITFAFPVVLGWTALTALLAYYIFPYGWRFDLR